MAGNILGGGGAPPPGSDPGYSSTMNFIEYRELHKNEYIAVGVMSDLISYDILEQDGVCLSKFAAYYGISSWRSRC